MLHFTLKREDTRGVTLIATAQSDAALHPRVLRSHLFKYIFKLMPPNREARRDVRRVSTYYLPSFTSLVAERISHQILAQNVRRRMEVAPELLQSKEVPLNYSALATQTEGYLPTDLNDLVSRAVHEARIRAGKEGLKAKVRSAST